MIFESFYLVNIRPKDGLLHNVKFIRFKQPFRCGKCLEQTQLKECQIVKPLKFLFMICVFQLLVA